MNIEQKIEALLDMWSRTRRSGVWLFVIAVLRSRYFLISLAFYALLLLIVSGFIISKYEPIRGSFDGVDQLLVVPPKSAPPPPPPQQKTSADTKEVKVATAAAATKTAATILTVANSASPVSYVKSGHSPQVAPSVQMGEFKVETDLTAKIGAANVARLQGVRAFQKSWGVTGEKKFTKAKFTCFKAKYQDGDWNCNPSDLINMLLQIKRWSNNRLDANIHPEVLDLGTDQLFIIKPPFVYLTGHKNFYLLDQEVTNIRDYLMLGGAIWADSALVGRRSRFDVAFRREMKRVFPDRDFEDVSADHQLFNEFFEKMSLPEGLNYYQEPIEMINIGKELAVLYTLNGYGHFWEARLKETENKIEFNQVIVGTNLNALIRARGGNRRKTDLYGKQVLWAHVYGPHALESIVCRNYNDKTVTDSYKFGINVIVHLLTRYMKYFKFLPVELPKKSTYHGRAGDANLSDISARTTNAVPATDAAAATNAIPAATNAVPAEEKKPPEKPKGLRGMKDKL